MSDDPRMEPLLDKLFDSHATPEQVCAACPELLPEVRRRWQEIKRVRAELDLLFPPSTPLEHRTTYPFEDAPLPTLPGYEVIQILGRGGVGVVYQAVHLRLKRTVAVKMLLSGPHASPNELERFLREAEAVARLHHPNVVNLYDFGEVDGRPYFTMELIEGGSLARKLADGPLPAREAAALVARATEAIQEAHQSSIIHRDLKPGNLLLTADGTPKVTDFGLARLGSDAGLTLSGAPVGTPSYMAPEQARGEKSAIGPATDVYALGAILYECVTGRPPFRAETSTATLQQVVADEPVPPARLNPRVPRDLQTICLKCLDKEPHKRYASAGALAEDLNRFLRNEPIRACPVSLGGRLSRWARHHPGLAALTGALVATALFAFAIIVWEWRVAEKARKAADHMTTRLVLDRGIALCERGDIGPGLLWLARGLEQAERSGDSEVIPALRTNLSAWSERLVVPQVSPPMGASVTTVAFHPDGKRLLVARWHDPFGKPGPGEARVLDPDTWTKLGPPMEHPQGVRAAAFSPDGTCVLTGGAEGSVRLWDAETGLPLCEPLQLGAVVSALAFAPNGQTFVTATIRSATTGEARIWDAGTLQPATPVLPHQGRVRCLAFSPDGKTLVTGGAVSETAGQPERGEVRFWNSHTGLPEGPVLVHAAPVSAVAFGPDGGTIVTGSDDGLLLRWRRETWERIDPPLHHPGAVRTAVFSPDGHRLLTGDGIPDLRNEREGVLRLWDFASGRLLACPWIHPDDVLSISPHPDGHRFATGCSDGHVRVFRVGDFEPRRWRYLDGIQAEKLFSVDGTTPIADGNVAVTFSVDGRRLLLGGETPDGRQAARLVDVQTGSVRDLLPDRTLLQADTVGAAGVSALGSRGARRTGRSLIDGVAFGPEGKIAVTTGQDGQIRLWNAESAALIQGPRSYGEKTIPWMMLMPDEHTLVTGARGRPIEVWDTETGKRVAQPIIGDAFVQAMTCTPDGRTLATAGDGGIIQLWDLRTGRLRSRLDGVAQTIWSLRFSPDGRSVLAGGDDTAWLFDVLSGKQRCEPLSHPATVWEARFSPDGSRLLTVCSDEYRHLHAGTAQLWDALSGKPLGPPLRHPVAGLAAAFDPEGRLVATGGFHGDVRFWDAATGTPVGPALVQSGPIPAIAFVAGTKLLAAAGKDGNLTLWPVPEARVGSPTEVRHWVHSLTGQNIDETEAVGDLN
jgi:WD40 repeat protein